MIKTVSTDYAQQKLEEKRSGLQQGDMQAEEKSPRVSLVIKTSSHRFRFRTMRGLEWSPLLSITTEVWKPVLPEMYAAMTWQELEAIAHLVRDSLGEN